MKVVAPNLKTETCRALFNLWVAARGESLLPRRGDIDPAALKKILAKIAIFVARAPGVAEIRLAGSKYRDVLGFEATGMNLIELTSPPIRRLRAYRSHIVVTWPCAALAEINFNFSSRISDTFEYIALPLESDQPNSPRMVIAAIESILGRRWQNEPSSRAIDSPAELFLFIDIGAGTPAATEPPPDFLVPDFDA